jgi:hypothetical protein
MVSVLIRYSLVDFDHCKTIIENLTSFKNDYQILGEQTFMDRENPSILFTQIAIANEDKARRFIQSELLNAESSLKKLKSPYSISLAKQRELIT